MKQKAGSKEALSNHGRQGRRDHRDNREAQLIWTFCVGLAVLVAALYQVGGSRSFFAHSTPEVVRTGNPLSNANDLSLKFAPSLQRGEMAYPSTERIPASR